MARRSAVETHTETLTAREAAFSAVAAEAAEVQPPEAHESYRVLARAQMLRGDFDMALAGARHIATLSGRDDPFDILLEIALEHGSTRLARTVLAEAEAQATPMQAAMIRARIAIFERDFPAAKAILVTAIEAEPDAAPLRLLLAETMVAAGTAADARAVLAVLGLAPVNPPAPADTDDAAQASDIEPDKKIG